MALSVTAVTRAIRDVLDGVFEGVRAVDVGAYKVGSPDDDASKARALSVPTYEINIAGLARHPASPAYTPGSQSIETLDLSIEFVYSLPATVQPEARYEAQATMIQNANLAIQALTFPGNLAVTSGDVATGIVSGLLFGPGGSGYPSASHDRDWDKQIGKTTIQASAVVVVAQETSTS